MRRVRTLRLLAVLAGWTTLAFAAAPDPDLVMAARAGDAARVRALLRDKAAANAASPDGTTALHWASRAGDVDTVAALLRAGAAPGAANRYGATPLSLAAGGGHAAVVRALLASGADLKAADAALPDRQTVLMHASRTGDTGAIKALVAAGADVDARETRTGTTAAIWAATANRGDALRLLAEAGANLDVPSKLTSYPHTANGVGLTGLEEGISYVGQTVLHRGGWTAVMYAAREGAVDAIRALGQLGANLDARDQDGANALTLAVINGHYDAMDALLDGGADPNVADSKGMTALYAAVDMHTIATTFGRPDPPREVIEGSVGAVERLLARGANPNATLTGPVLRRVYNGGDGRLGEGATAFMRAARGGDVRMMKMLIASGADPLRVQKNGNSPLILAASAGSGRASDNNPDRVTEAEVIEALTLGLELGLDVNAPNAQGDTVAHTAATTNLGSIAVIRFLHARGAKFDVKNKADRTPLESVLRSREQAADTVALLREITGEK